MPPQLLRRSDLRCIRCGQRPIILWEGPGLLTMCTKCRVITGYGIRPDEALPSIQDELHGIDEQKDSSDS